ncbi:MAG: hypothetical protein QXH91_09595 [Candidatus Bathyarchaeia archaeon]
MRVIERVVKAIRPGASFITPSGRSKFVVERVDYDGIKLRVGQGWPISIKTECLQGIPSFLKGKGWVRIGATHGQPPEGSLDEYLQKFTYGVSAASDVVPILEKIGIVEVNRKRPYRIRLIE